MSVVSSWRVEQRSQLLSFVWLSVWSALLTLFTLTLFRFWQRTLFRRKLWGETRINDEPLEYLGKGWELFVGFLLAVLVLGLPPAIGLFLVQQYLGPIWVAVVIVALNLLIYVLVGVAIFLARRYQLSRTMWRGVRFRQTGSAWAYGFAAFGYGILTALTLGWFGPAARLRLARRMWKGVYYGDMPFSWSENPEGRKEPVYLSFALSWFGMLLPFAGLVAAVISLGLIPKPEEGLNHAKLAAFYGLTLGCTLIYLLLAAWHEAVMLRRVTQAISIGTVQLRSRFNTWNYVGLVLAGVLITVCTLGLGTLAILMLMWRTVANRLELDGALDIGAIQQAEGRGPRTGEGLADAFDLGGGF